MPCEPCTATSSNKFWTAAQISAQVAVDTIVGGTISEGGTTTSTSSDSHSLRANCLCTSASNFALNISLKSSIEATASAILDACSASISAFATFTSELILAVISLTL